MRLSIKYTKYVRSMFVTAIFVLAFLQLSSLPNMAQEIKAEKIETLPPPAPLQGKSIVRGKVVYDDTGRPVRYANVFLMDENGRAGKSGLTDKDGTFEIKGVNEGTYYATVNAPGLMTPFGQSGDMFEAEIKRQVNPEFIGSLKDFSPAIKVDGKDEVKVEVRAKRGGAINGRITYADGDPAVNVGITIWRKKDGKFSRVTTNLSVSAILGTKTDDRGVYRIAGLPAGEYVVSATEPASHQDAQEDNALQEAFSMAGNMFGSSSMLVTYYPDVNSKERATIINVVTGQEQNDINISIPDRALYKISGTVIARNDKSPIPKAKISIKSKGESKGGSVFDFLRSCLKINLD